MGTWVALLRGINVGGNNKVPMPVLRDLVTRLGHTDVQTYVNSGNIVFGSAARSEAKVASGIEDAIAEALGLKIRVLVRSAAELSKVVAANPFPEHADEPAKLAVLFLERPVAAPELPAVPDDAIEDVHSSGRHLYVWYPDGMGRSKLDDRFNRPLAKLAGTVTARNWRTVLALQAMTAG